MITALILGLLYFAFTMFGGKKLLENAADKARQEQTTEATKPEEQASQPSAAATDMAAASSDNPASDAKPQAAFQYQAPVPTAGVLKGVVELGASGFNSFIVKIDKQKNWKLEKAEYNNSLVFENMATEDDIRVGLKKYIAGMLDYGVSGREIHFVVSSGAVKAEGTQKIVKALKSLNFFVNTVTAQQEGAYGLKSVLPKDFEQEAFVADIGSGNTKISWKASGGVSSLESYGAKYFADGIDDALVAKEVSAKVKQIPASQRKLCFIIGGVPSDLAKVSRKGKERYTILDVPDSYKMDKAKAKAGINIYKAIAETTGCQQFVFDWDANFTIGFLLNLP
jgi:hypothetical protein